jgi:hypothetical protein
MRQWELSPPGRLQKFKIVAVPDSGDVIGIIAGKTTAFDSRYDIRATVSRFLPEGGPGLCGESAVRWSDHCGQYAELVPVRRPPDRPL